MERRRVKLTLLSPLHIGSEETLSPIVDFIWHKGQVFILNKDKLIQTLEKKGLDTLFFQAVYNQEKLSQFLEENKINFRPFIAKTIPAPQQIKSEIKRFARSADTLCLPGSSIKGAIRTAILFWLFKTDKKWQERLRQTYNQWKHPKDAFKKTKLDTILGPNSHWDALRNLAVTDNLNPIPESGLKIIEVKRIYKHGKQTKIKTALEVLTPNTTSVHEIRLGGIKEIGPTKLSFLAEGNFEELIKVINFWAQAIIKAEKEDFKKNLFLTAFYRRLEKEIEQEKKDDFLLRLGGFKTYFDQTLGLILKEILPEKQWQAFVKRIAPKKPSSLKAFPTTLWVTSDNQPLGWVKGVICNE
jgi:CRISPR-associated protein Csm5